MSRVQFKVTMHYSRGARAHLEYMADPVMEKRKLAAMEMNQLDLRDNTYISVH